MSSKGVGAGGSGAGGDGGSRGAGVSGAVFAGAGAAVELGRVLRGGAEEAARVSLVFAWARRRRTNAALI